MYYWLESSVKVIRKYHFFPFNLILIFICWRADLFSYFSFLSKLLWTYFILFLYGFMLLSLYFSEIASIWWGVFFGFCFDVYFYTL